MTSLKVYLINLEGSDERLESAARSFRGAGLAFTRVAAVDGRATPAVEMPRYSEKASRKAYGRALKSGEIGCFLSHLACLEQFRASGARFALVTEDDITIPEGRGPVLQALLDWLQGDDAPEWDAINLVNPAKKFYAPIRDFAGPGGENFTLCRAYYYPISGAGTLWSQAGAERFLRENEVIAMPVDAAIREMCGRRASGLAFRPALLGCVPFSSDIDMAADRTRASAGWYHGFIVQLWRMKHRFWALRHMIAGRAG